MKAILMSIKPKWCEKIFSGEKTVEVRKVAPKIEPPFKVYVYESLGKKFSCSRCEGCPIRFPLGCNEGAGAVVGEFVCDKVEENIPDYHPVYEEFFYSVFEYGNDCLSSKEIQKYGKGDTLYGLHITAPKWYDTPKELSEFVSCKYYKDEECLLSNKTHCKYRVPDLNPDGSVNIFECRKRVTRPPQSWMYVEEIEE